MKALFNLNDMKHEYFFTKDVKYIPTGIKTFDNMTNDLPTRTVSVVTGVPKEGKSTFVHRVALNAVDKGFKVLLIDGEHNRRDIVQRLYTLVIGHDKESFDYKQENKFTTVVPKKHILDLLKNWHKDNLFIFSKYLAPMNTLDELFKFTEDFVKKEHVDLIIWDNLMMLVDGPNVEKNENQSRFMKRACDLAKFQNCHCMVVAHPNKGAVKGEPMGMYDVLGSSDIVNLVDYLVQIMRVYHDNPEVDDPADAYARIILNRTRGRNIGDVPLIYDTKVEGLFEMKQDGTPLKYSFNWKGEGNQELLNDKPF